jgi:hypothetical protein
MIPFTTRAAAVLLLVAATGCAARIATPAQAARQEVRLTYEYKLISSDDNFPAVDLQRDSLGMLELALHRGLTVGGIARKFRWSDSLVLRRLHILRDADLASLDDGGRWHAGVMVMTLADTADALHVGGEVVMQAERAIIGRLSAIRAATESLSGFKGLRFSDVSLLVLSDVLLDNWQIHAVESGFLGAERPLRKGKRFYYSIKEKPATQEAEAFNVYGNAYRSLRGASFTIGVYGNHRNSGTLLAITRDDSALSAAATYIAAAHAAAGTDPALAGEPSARGTDLLVRANLLQNGRLAVPVLDSADDAALQRIAAAFTDELIGLLEAARPELERRYLRSEYAHEVSFPEYAIWWYHLFYSAVTEALVRNGAISLPPSGNATYLTVP